MTFSLVLTEIEFSFNKKGSELVFALALSEESTCTEANHKSGTHQIAFRDSCTDCFKRQLNLIVVVAVVFLLLKVGTTIFTVRL